MWLGLLSAFKSLRGEVFIDVDHQISRLLRGDRTSLNQALRVNPTYQMKEEQVLFPYIMVVESHVREGAPIPQAGFGSVRNPIGQMEYEHESAGQALAKLREVTFD